LIFAVADDQQIASPEEHPIARTGGVSPDFLAECGFRQHRFKSGPQRNSVMSIEQQNTIDLVVPDPKTGKTVLVLYDFFEWYDDKDDGEHLLMLQEKMNTYLAFVEGGQLYRDWPEAVGGKIEFLVLAFYPLGVQAKRFYELATKTITDAGFSLRFKLSLPGSPTDAESILG
jgi:hypothetical protein